VKDLFITKRRYTPEIDFRANGQLSIKGISLLENSYEVYSEAITWLKELREQPLVEIKLSLKFVYVDTSSMRSLVDMIKMLNEFGDVGFMVSIDWFYEEEDHDHLDTGEALQSIAKVPFNLLTIDIDDYEL